MDKLTLFNDIFDNSQYLLSWMFLFVTGWFLLSTLIHSLIKSLITAVIGRNKGFNISLSLFGFIYEKDKEIGKYKWRYNKLSLFSQCSYSYDFSNPSPEDSATLEMGIPYGM